MLGLGRNKTLLLVVASIFALPVSYAQTVPGGERSGDTGKAERATSTAEAFETKNSAVEEQSAADAGALGETRNGPPASEPQAETKQSVDIDSGKPEGASTRAGFRQSDERNLVPDMLVDQKEFWTAPLRLRLGDVHWLVPFAAFTSALIGSDTS